MHPCRHLNRDGAVRQEGPRGGPLRGREVAQPLRSQWVQEGENAAGWRGGAWPPGLFCLAGVEPLSPLPQNLPYCREPHPGPEGPHIRVLCMSCGCYTCSVGKRGSPASFSTRLAVPWPVCLFGEGTFSSMAMTTRDVQFPLQGRL